MKDIYQVTVNYYNEFDPKTAAWLRELIKEGLIPKGKVDDRSITAVQPGDLRGFTQCHFFAGIGGWSRALKLAGWPEDRQVWTGSCPCQPFSVGNATKLGLSDERHLWPTWFELIKECNPATIFGEQVPAAIKHGWLTHVRMDLEGQDYAFGRGIIPATFAEADHERKRLLFVADSCCERCQGHQSIEYIPFAAEQTPQPINGDPLIRAKRALEGDYSHLLPCDGLSVQLERDAIKGYGNAIVPQIAAEFIKAYLDATQGT